MAARIDVTERHRAEDDARRSRDELAHFLRVSTVGELTTSLAHELNQPLTAILANAQAARRILGVGPRCADEVPEILADIIEEDKRAGEVIRRLRDLLRKGEPEHAPLDLNVAGHGRRPAGGQRRHHPQRDHPAATWPRSPRCVIGDRIQIQQVVLNLLLNAMDAMADVPVAAAAGPGRRRRSRRRKAPCSVAVSDTGTGLRRGPSGSDLRALLHHQARAAWAWASRSRARSSPRTAAASGRATTPEAARPSSSPCPWPRPGRRRPGHEAARRARRGPRRPRPPPAPPPTTTSTRGASLRRGPDAAAAPRGADGPLRVVTFNVAYAKRIPEAIAALRADPLRGRGRGRAPGDGRPGNGRHRPGASASTTSTTRRPATPKTGRDFGNAILSPWPIEESRKILLPGRSRGTPPGASGGGGLGARRRPDRHRLFRRT